MTISQPRTSTRPQTDFQELEIECVYSNIGEEWIAAATHNGHEMYVGKGPTRPEALRQLADELEGD